MTPMSFYCRRSPGAQRSARTRRRRCRRLLKIDELNSGAHYVLALCREAEEINPQPPITTKSRSTWIRICMPRLHLVCSRVAPATPAPLDVNSLRHSRCFSARCVAAALVLEWLQS